MRLKPEVIAAIRQEVSLADPDAAIWLFGSRVDDRARGGDIDLLVVSNRLAFAEQLRLRMAILDRIGWQQLDLLVRRHDQLGEPIVAHAMESGVKL